MTVDRRSGRRCRSLLHLQIEPGSDMALLNRSPGSCWRGGGTTSFHPGTVNGRRSRRISDRRSASHALTSSWPSGQITGIPIAKNHQPQWDCRTQPKTSGARCLHYEKAHLDSRIRERAAMSISPCSPATRQARHRVAFGHIRKLRSAPYPADGPRSTSEAIRAGGMSWVGAPSRVTHWRRSIRGCVRSAAPGARGLKFHVGRPSVNAYCSCQAMKNGACSSSSRKFI